MKIQLLAALLAATCVPSLALTPGKYSASAVGIKGPVPVVVTMTKDRIASIAVGQNNETPGIGQTAIAQLPARIVQSQSIGIDGVSGATVTSSAIFKAVGDCIRQAGGDPGQFRAKSVAKAVLRKESRKTDLVIVGGGAAGMIAAINAAEQGLKVLLVEKMPFLGGASSICGGSVIVTGSRIQKEAGETGDSPARLAYDLLKNGHQKNDLSALTFYANNLGSSIDWIASKGVEFSDKLAYRAEFQVPRMVSLKGGCPRYAQTLRSLVAKQKNIEVLLSTRAKEILMRAGQAEGIRATNQSGTEYTIRAKAVILSTGGFGYNKDMLGGDLSKVLYYGPVSSTGDGHRMAEQAGAQLQLMEYGKIYPQGIEVGPGRAKSTLLPNIEAYSQAGILVNRAGKRVVNEKGTGAAITAVQMSQPDKTLFLALDAKSYRAFIAKSGIAQADLDRWFAANGKSAPVFVHAQSAAAAAQAAGIDPEGLKATVDRYNGFVAKGFDEDFQRPAKFMAKAIDTDADFYIIEQKPRFATTMGGVKVTTSMEVVGRSGKVIPGLYAAGEIANSVHGDDSTPGGNISFGMTTGKTVSDVIAARLKKGR